MKHFKPVLVIACVLAVAGAANAATIFSDNFSDTSNLAKAKWSSLAATGFSTAYSNGALTLTNTRLPGDLPADSPSVFSLPASLCVPLKRGTPPLPPKKNCVCRGG